MQIRFQWPDPRGLADLPADVLVVDDRAGERLDLSVLALTGGAAAFPHGDGALTRIVLSAAPTLDDLLAASILLAQHERRPVPDGLRGFAQYAALAREGLRPSDHSPEVSLEAVFLAMRGEAKGELEEPEAAEEFLASWRRLERAMWAAAERGIDPFATNIAAADPAFARERAFLRHDHAVFEQDVLRGERWRAKIPGGPPIACALVLDRPRSVLFKYWSRIRGDLLLGVTRRDGVWVFSTDPVQRLSLQDLWRALQDEERSAGGDEANPWFDGERFNHTLVASPRGQSKLDRGRVLACVKRWCDATPAEPDREAGRVAGAAAAGPRWYARRRTWVATAASAVIVGSLTVTVGPMERKPTEPTAGPPRGIDPTPPAAAPFTRGGKDYAVFFASEAYADGRAKYPRLDNPVRDAREIRRTLTSEFGFDCEEVVPNQTWQGIHDKLAELQRRTFGESDQLLLFFAGHGGFDHVVAGGSFVASDVREFSYNDLRPAIAKIPCRHILVVLDVCHGGTFGNRFRADPNDDPYSGPSRGQRIAHALGPRSPVTRLYLSSVGNATANDGAKGGHSPFAAALLRAMADKGDPNGVISAYQLYVAIKGGNLGPQIGPFENDESGSDFLFIRRPRPATRPATESSISSEQSFHSKDCGWVDRHS